jgi:23S rRNA (guanosine2251-2'-O)-methyltransferase
VSGASPRSPRERARRRREAGARAAPDARVELYGIHSIREALRARRRSLYRLRLRQGTRHPEHRALRTLAQEAGVPVEALEEEPRSAELNAQGALLEAGPLPELSLDALVELQASPRTLVALDGVEDPRNLGAIARAAEATGALGLLLTRRRSPPLSAAVSRASAGAIEWLPAARVPNLRRALNDLKTKGFWVFGAEIEASLGLYELPPRLLQGDRVVVLGGEARGLGHGIRQVVDHRVEVPMRGRIESLNVASAAAVILYELRRRELEGAG